MGIRGGLLMSGVRVSFYLVPSLCHMMAIGALRAACSACPMRACGYPQLTGGRGERRECGVYLEIDLLPLIMHLLSASYF